MAALGINVYYLLMQLFGVIILTLILNAALYKPMLTALESRKKRIATGLEDARQAALARENAEADAKKVLDTARQEAGRVRAEASTSLDAVRKSAEAEAMESARQIIAKAEAEATERRNQALGDMRGQIASIAIAAANRIVGESLDEKRQRALINDFFSKVPAGVSALKGSTAEITSALPLTSAEQDAAKRSINTSKISFKVDPSILGGLVVRVGDQVVDDSVASQMNGMRESLK